MHMTLDALLRMTPEQALFRVRNASRVPAAVCRGLADHVFALRMSDPGLMVRWGRVADAAAERTADLVTAGLSRAHFGNSLRVTGDFAAAAAVLDEAERLLPTSHPLIHEFRASLLQGCRDFTGAKEELRLWSYGGKDREACSLYKSARDGYREMEMWREVALSPSTWPFSTTNTAATPPRPGKR
jgi:hypothetical protein